jgi:hypothetical protein
MAGLAKFTVTSINGDTALTGERLFNKNRIVSVKEYGSGSFIAYRSLRSADPVIHDEYIVSDSFSTVTDIFSDYTDEYYTVSVYDNPSNTLGNSTERIISAQDIVYGVPYGDSDSLLYVLRGNSIIKRLCNTTLDDIVAVDSDFSDWFLPSLDELQAMYDNLHAEGVGDFEDGWYWSSTELGGAQSDSDAWAINFSNNSSYSTAKSVAYRVRPARTFTASIGQYSLRDTGPGGGLIFYIDGTTYYEAAESDISDGYYWSNITSTLIGTTGTAIGTGITNTAAIIAQSGHITSAAYASMIWNGEFSLATYIYSGAQKSVRFKLPTGKSITINWGDGNNDTINGNGATYVSAGSSYAENGNYNISISGDLFYLTALDISGPGSTGDISDYSSLLSLTDLRVYNNSVSGDVSVWSALTNLTYIEAWNTSVSGDISSWSKLTSLTNIIIQGTSVSGDISSWSTLTNLLQIYASGTSVSGDISSWSTLTSLRNLRAYNTNVSGDISSWSTLTSLRNLRAYNTNVSGDISSWSTLTSMEYLLLSHTSVSGDISSWSTLTNIVTLSIYATSVSGDISSWSTLINASSIDVSETSVSGDISSWSTLSSIQAIRVYNTSVSGDISSWSTLTTLGVMYCQETSVTFDSDAAWTDHDHDIDISDCGLNSTQVNNALIAFAGGSFSGETISIGGSNDVRTSASDAAVASLRLTNIINVNE